MVIYHQKKFSGYKTIFINDKQLNTENIANEVSSFDADFAFIFGVNLILDQLLKNYLRIR